MYSPVKKRGFGHVDWVMSLAIFILFLAWFFIFLEPVLTHEESVDALASKIQSKVLEESVWSVEILPVFVKEESGTEFPFMLHTPWHEGSFGLAKPYTTYRDRVYVWSDPKNGTVPFVIAHSDAEYVPSQAVGNNLSTGDMEVILDEDRLDHIRYRGDNRVFFEWWGAGRTAFHEAVESEVQERGSLGVLALDTNTYIADASVVTDGPVLFFTYEPQTVQPEPAGLRGELRVTGYTAMFGEDVEPVLLNRSGCSEHTAPRLLFLDEEGSRRGALAIAADSNFTSKVCSTFDLNTSIELEFPVTNVSLAFAFGRDGASVDTYPGEIVYGAKTVMRGQRQDVGAHMDVLSPTQLKEEIGLSEALSFSARLLNETSPVMQVQTESLPDNRNIYFFRDPCDFIDQFGEITTCTVEVAIW